MNDSDFERERTRLVAALRTYAALESERDRNRRVLRGETVRQALVNALLSTRNMDVRE